MRINFNVNREYDSYFFFILIVLNFELVEVSILGMKLFEVSSLEISLEDEKYFERIMIVDKVDLEFVF